MAPPRECGTDLEGRGFDSPFSQSSPLPPLPRPHCRGSACFGRRPDSSTPALLPVSLTRRSIIGEHVTALERLSPLPEQTDEGAELSGKWQLIYTTVTIQGASRTKLGLRQFVSLGELTQTIDFAGRRATNAVGFEVNGLKSLGGSYTLETTFEVATVTRVNIKVGRNVFRKSRMGRLT